MRSYTDSRVLELPPGYYLNEDPELLILCRFDDSVVAAFSASAASSESIKQVARNDYDQRVTCDPSSSTDKRLDCSERRAPIPFVSSLLDLIR